MTLFLAQEPETQAVLFGTLTALLLAFILVVSFCNIRSLDLWWHVKTGEWIWQNHTVPKTDPFSHTAEGSPWISHEWLFGLLAYSTYRAGGITALVSAKALLLAVLFAAAAWTARIRGASPAMTFLVLTASYSISRFRFTERPELLSVPLAVGFLLVHELSLKRPRALALMPAVQFVWVNVHGGTALLGWVLAGTVLLDRVWGLRATAAGALHLPHPGRVRGHIAAALGTIAVSFANPHGARALFYGLLRTESPLDNKEFQSLWKMMQRGLDLSMILFSAFALLLLALLMNRARTARAQEWLLYPSLLALTAVFFRFRPLFVFLLAPGLAWHLSQGKWLSRVRWWIPTLAAVLLMTHSAALERKTYFYRFGAAIHSGVFPVEAAEFVKKTGISGKMFNSYSLGGYLLWKLWPEQRVFIDGREDVYLGPGVLEDYVHCFDSSERWQGLVQKYGIEFAIVRYPEAPPASTQQSLELLAFPRRSWALVYFDDVVTIYLRRYPRFEEIIRRYEVKSVQPLQLSSYLDLVLKDPEQTRLFLEEVQAQMRSHPSSFRGHFALGMLAVRRGPDHLGEALRQFRRTVEINPDYAPAYVNLGSIYLYMGRRAEAEQALKKAISLDHNSLAEEQLKQLRNLR